MQCSVVKLYRRFGRTCYLHLKVRIVRTISDLKMKGTDEIVLNETASLPL